MDATAWAAKLVVTAALLGKFPVPPPVAPPVSIVPGSFLAARFCDGACSVRGAYVPGEGVLLAASLDIDANPLDRSVLLHELVHFLQDVSGRFQADGPCDRWRDRELEAYGVQDRYLARYNLGLGDGAKAALQVLPAGCSRESDTPEPPPVHLYRDSVR